MKSVSFVIPHMGREQLLIETLESIALLHKQDIDKQDIDLQVVVVSKNESFSEHIQGFKKSLKLILLNVKQSLTISEQRNLGVSHTSSDYLAFIDADIALSPDWLTKMLAILENKEIVLASAIQVASESPTQLEYLRVVLSNLSIDCEMEFLPGRNLLLSRDTFTKSGGFPSDLVTCEDYVFTQRVSQYGKLFYSSKAQYVHLGEDKEFWPMAKKEVWRGQSNLASIKGRKVPLSEYPSFIAPPLFSFTVLASLCFLLLLNLSLLAFSLGACLSILGLYSFRLWKKRHKYLNLSTIVYFYAIYFPARTIGTVLGAVKNLNTSDHKK